MTKPTDPTKIDLLRKKLQEAVFFQIQLWYAAEVIAELANCDMGQALKWATDMSVGMNDGTEWTMQDLDSLFREPDVPNIPTSSPWVN